MIVSELKRDLTVIDESCRLYRIYPTSKRILDEAERCTLGLDKSARMDLSVFCRVISFPHMTLPVRPSACPPPKSPASKALCNHRQAHVLATSHATLQSMSKDLRVLGKMPYHLAIWMA